MIQNAKYTETVTAVELALVNGEIGEDQYYRLLELADVLQQKDVLPVLENEKISWKGGAQ
ncbi:MAG: hypothetical protein LBM08_00785 [Dysgonamonadaceae bacterium]|jgi:hypothetical protein|nr:hypothetical protein [Dysgonamonadaceae bacterium]